MSIVTEDEYRSALNEKDGAETESEVLYGRMAGLTRALEVYCCRVFPMLASCAETSSVAPPDLDLTLTVPHHGLKVGDRVSTASTRGTLSGIQTLTAVTKHTITFNVAITEADANVLIDADHDVSIRPVRTVTKATRGSDSVFLDPRPVAELVSVTVDDTLLEAADYVLSERHNGASALGRVMLKARSWPVNVRDCLYADGATIEFVSGEEWPDPALRMAMLDMLANLVRRQGLAEFKSERYEDYSYTKLSPEEVGKLFGESDHVIKQFQLPNV